MNAIDESDETNNTYSQAITSSKSDLVVTAITPSPLYEGQPNTFSATIKNIGSIATPTGKALRVGFKIDDGETIFWTSNYTTSIAIGGTKTLAVTAGTVGATYTPTLEGTHSVTAIVDDMNAIDESDETNNTYTQTITLSKSDLIITSITPVAIYAGQSTTFSAIVKNIGSIATPSGKALRVGFKIDGGETIFWTSNYTTSIAVGGTKTLTASYTVSDVGAHSITATVDDMNAIDETDEANNTYTQQSTTSKSDLVVTAINPSPLYAGQPNTFSAVVKNIGSIATPTGKVLRVGFKIDDGETIFWTSNYTTSIAVGGTKTLAVTAGTAGTTYTPTLEGIHSVTAIVDDTNAIDETDETNNTYTQQTASSKSDLIITSVTPVTIYAGQPTTFSAIVKNIGSIATTAGAALRIGFKIDDGETIFWTTNYTTSIAAGGTKTLTASYTVSDVGTHTITAIVDDMNAIDEDNETNNTYTQTFTSSKSDLVVTAINPSPLYAGQPNTFSAVVKNIGTIATPTGKALRVGFKIDDGETIFWTANYTTSISAAGTTTLAVAAGTSGATYTAAVEGTHLVTAIVDDMSEIDEIDEINNSFTQQITSSKSDLVITAITPVTIYAGQPTTFSVTVKNIGSIATPTGKALRVGFKIDGGETIFWTANYTTSITVGGSKALTASYTVSDVGTHTITAIVDDMSAIDEVDETNNIYSQTFTASKSDLIITPITIYSGQPTTFSAIVKNIGSIATPSGKALRVGFKIDGGETIFWTSDYTTSIAAGGTKILAVTAGTAGTTYTSADVGTHTVMAIVDDMNAMDEADETNNSFTQQITSSKSDLVVTAITPITIYAGQPITFNATVKNVGSIATPTGKALRIGFKIDDGETIYWTANYTTSIAVGGTTTLAVTAGTVGTTYTAAVEGVHSVTAIVDDMNVIDEVDETNNTYSQTITSSKSDLVITSITPEAIYAGEPTTFSATVKNIGSIATPVGAALRVGFKIDNGETIFWTSNYTKSISAGGIVTLTVSAGVSGATYTTSEIGTHSITAIVDDMNAIEETDETNNTYTQQKTSSKCDLIVTEISPFFSALGQPITFSAAIQNIGAVATPIGKSFRVGFKIDDGETIFWTSNYTYPLGVNTIGFCDVSAGISGITYTPNNGTHTVTAIVDDMNTIDELEEANNTYTQQINLGKSDLVVTHISPSIFHVGQPITFIADIKNIGQIATPEGVAIRVGFKVDNSNTILWTNNHTSSILPSDYASLATTEVTYAISELGPHLVTAIVDDLKAIDELDEKNNIHTQTILIDSPPDLIVTDISFSPLEIKEGENVKFSATIKNCGIGTINEIGSYRVAFSANGNPPEIWGDFGIDSLLLEPGQSVTLTANGGTNGALWLATLGSNVITATVDQQNKIFESNESNNSYSKELFVKKGPDLVITDVAFSSPNPIVGEEVHFRATVKNIGEGISSAGRVAKVGFKVDNSETIIWADTYSWFIEPNQSIVLEASSGINGALWLATLGNHTITAVVNEEHYIAENKLNNSFSTTLTVTSERVLDLNADYDHDGITNEYEITSGTDMNNADTDGDGVSDYDELNTYLTSPINRNSDGDELFDGTEIKLGLNPLATNEKEVVSRETKTYNESINVTAYGNQNISIAPFHIIESDNIILNSMSGIVGKPVEISIGGYQFDSALINFKYNSQQLGAISEDDLTVFWIDPINRKLVALSPDKVTIDKINHTITGNVAHFSTYCVGSKNMATDVPGINIVFAIDQSVSMATTDPNYYRLKGIERFVTCLQGSNKIGLVEYALSASVKQILTNDKQQIIDALSNMRYTLPYTNIGDGLNLSGNLLQNNEKNVIILLSDGGNNIGYADSEVIDLASNLNNNGILINTVAFGNANMALMSAIANAGHGEAFSLNDPSDIDTLYYSLAKQFELSGYSDYDPCVVNDTNTPIVYHPESDIVSPIWKLSDENCSDTVQTMLLELNFDWYFATTQLERDVIVQKANDLRSNVADGIEWWLDQAKQLTEAAANEFSWFLGGSVSTNDRNEWLALNQIFQEDLTINDTNGREIGMFIAGLSVGGEGSIFKNGVRSWIKRDLKNSIKKNLSKTAWKKFTHAMTKGIISAEGESGIKIIKGYVGNTFYNYELKILGDYGEYRLVGNLERKSGHIIWDKLVKHADIRYGG